MIIKLERIEVQSRQGMEMIDITPQVEQAVAASGVHNGLVLAMTAHTSSGLLVTEGIECLERDVLAHLERLAPKEPPAGTFGYWHNRYLDYDGRLGFNAGDHLKSILGGVNCFFPIENGKVVRGSRQKVYFVEYDGPLARTVFIQVLGEAA
ncbi:MAG: secondary thiamine-phosphate synthase enzyme YjbQ [Bryobacteraceae bacterium]